MYINLDSTFASLTRRALIMITTLVAIYISDVIAEPTISNLDEGSYIVNESSELFIDQIEKGLQINNSSFEQIPETNLHKFYGGYFAVVLDDLTYQFLSNRKFLSLILLGVGLISFGCLRIRMRRIKAVKVR